MTSISRMCCELQLALNLAEKNHLSEAKLISERNTEYGLKVE